MAARVPFLYPPRVGFAEHAALVEGPSSGAVVTFAGVVRDHDGGRGVTTLDYEGHPSAGDVIARVAGEVADAHPGVRALAVSHRVGPLAGDDLLHDLGGDRLDVGRVGELRVGHDRGRVGVDQDDPQALLAQDAAGLGAGVVELAGLADDDRAGPDHQHAGDVGALGHLRPPSARS